LVHEEEKRKEKGERVRRPGIRGTNKKRKGLKVRARPKAVKDRGKKGPWVVPISRSFHNSLRGGYGRDLHTQKKKKIRENAKLLEDKRSKACSEDRRAKENRRSEENVPLGRNS